MIKHIKLYVHPGPPYSTSVIVHCKIDPNWFAWQEAFADCVSLAQITLRANRVGDLGVGWPWWGLWGMLWRNHQVSTLRYFFLQKNSNGAMINVFHFSPRIPITTCKAFTLSGISVQLVMSRMSSSKSIQKIGRWVPKHWDFLQNIGVLQRRIKFWQKGSLEAIFPNVSTWTSHLLASVTLQGTRKHIPPNGKAGKWYSKVPAGKGYVIVPWRLRVFAL